MTPVRQAKKLLRIVRQGARSPFQGRPSTRISPHGPASLLRWKSENRAITGVEAQVHEAAVLAAGYHDFGDDGYREGLGRLLEAIDSSEYTLQQRDRIRKTLVVSVLRSRLYSERGWKEHPESRQNPVPAPLVVCGLPRTGTTALQKLLSMDRRLQGLNGWLVTYPMPRPPRAKWRSFAEYRAVDAIHKAAMNPSVTVKAAHLRTADEVDEPLELISQSFISNFFPAIFRLPSYDAWFRTQSYRATYSRFADNLRLIGGTERDKPWLLQNPSNILALDDLIEQFPDCRILWTHRDPGDAIASLSSLLAMVRTSIVGTDVATADIAMREVALWSEAVTTAMASRERHPSNFHDVDFGDLVADPIGVARAIYERFHMDIDKPTEAAMLGWIAANPQGKHGVHSYSREKFGLSEALIERKFGSYMEKFKLMEKPAASV
jgi:hypothetical protein